MISTSRSLLPTHVIETKRSKTASNTKLAELRFKTEQDLHDIEEQKGKETTPTAARDQAKDIFIPKQPVTLEDLSSVTIERDIDEAHLEPNIDRDQYQEPLSPTSDTPINFRSSTNFHVTVEPDPSTSPAQEDAVEDVFQSEDILVSNLLETKLFVRRITAFSLFMGIASVLLLFSSMSVISFQGLFIASFCYLLYFILENIFRITRYNRSLTYKKEDVFRIFDALCIIMFLASVNLKLLKMLPLSTVVSMCPLGAVILVYLFMWNKKAKSHMVELSLRSICLIQGTLIALKLDSILHADWIIVLTIIWIWTAMLVLYIIAFAFLLILSLLTTIVDHIKDRRLSSIIFTQTFGALWQLMYYSLGIIASGTFYALAQAQKNNQDSRMLIRMAHLDYTICYILAAFSVMGYKPLVSYLSKYSMMELLMFEDNLTQQVSDEKSLKDRPKVETRKQNALFSILSSTYFLPFRRQTSSQSHERVKKIKDVLKRIGSRKLSNKDPRCVQSKEAVEINIHESPRIEIKSMIVRDHRRASYKNRTLHIDASNNAKVQFSVDDVDDFKAVKTPAKTQDELSEQACCYICCDKPQNAVLMNCGHGGICYDCAMMVMERNSECMQCRSKFVAVYKIDIPKKFAGIARGVEIAKLVGVDDAELNE